MTAYLSTDLVRPALLQRPRIGRAGVDALEERDTLGMAVLEPAARRGSLERKAHLDVGAGKLAAGEPFALAELAFPIGHVLLELRIDQRRQRRVGHLAHQGPQQ